MNRSSASKSLRASRPEQHQPRLATAARAAPVITNEQFAQLYAEHGAMLLRVVARANVPQRAVEDVAAEVWTEAFEKHPSHFDGRDFRSWICEIARNRALDWLRRKANRQTALDEAGDTSNRSERSPLDQIIDEERRAALRDCVQKLNETRQAIVVGRFMGESSKEIGERLHLTEAQVNKQMHTLRQELKDCVRGKLKDDIDEGAL